MSAKNHHLPEEPVRSKGEATLLLEGHPELSASVHHISASGIGVVAAHAINPGTAVEIHIHDQKAHGTVEGCRPEGEAFYIAITLAA